MTTHCCLNCGKPITWQFAICSECEKTLGHGPKEWPSWLTFMWRDEMRLRRQDKRIAKYETTFIDLPDGNIVGDGGCVEGEDLDFSEG